MEVNPLKKIATECRMDILSMLEKAGNGHPGGSLSVIDILVTLFFHEMNLEGDDKDHFILSKGHGVPALYSIFAKLGWIKKEELFTLRQINSRLQGHPDRVRLPFIEASTGSLGQGLSIAQGIALGLKLKKSPARVFCVLGDGETQEGQVWETAMSAPKFQLNNLIAILDNNNGQIDGHVDQVMDIRPISTKWGAFNWATFEVDGHNFEDLIQTFEEIKKIKDEPILILAKTVKGKGVSFMENKIDWHGVAPNKEQLEKALLELKKNL